MSEMRARRLYSISPESEATVAAIYTEFWPRIQEEIEKIRKVKVWWEALPLIRKHLIVDYKFTDFDWDNLTDTDKQLIEQHYLSSEQSTKKEE